MENDYRNKYHNLKANMNNLKPKFLDEPVHNEIQRFCHCIDALCEYSLFRSNIVGKDKYFGVLDDLDLEFHDVRITIPVYDKR